VQGRAKTLHPCLLSPRPGFVEDDQVGHSRPVCPPGNDAVADPLRPCRAETAPPAASRWSFPPQAHQRCRSSASNGSSSTSSSSSSSPGQLSVTSLSLSLRPQHQAAGQSPHQARTNSLETAGGLGSSRDSESDYLSEILGEYVASSSPPTTHNENTPRCTTNTSITITPRKGSNIYHSKLLRMRCPHRDSTGPDSLTTQTVDLDKPSSQCQSFKKLLILTQLPSGSRGQQQQQQQQQSPLRSARAVGPDSSASDSSGESPVTARERSILVGLHQLSRQHRNRASSHGSRADPEAPASSPELPSLQPGAPGTQPGEERPGSTLVDQWLGGCQVIGSRLEPTESAKRRIEFSVPSIEEETESLS
jgi:hypothetical protein